MIRKNLLNLAIGSAISLTSTSVFADLPVKANLSIETQGEIIGCTAGATINPVTGDCSLGGTDLPALNIYARSFFILGTSETGISGNNGITLGIVQDAANNHPGDINGSEIPDIDNPWLFASNTGMHQTTSPVTIISDDGNGTVTLDYSGWNVAWGNVDSIPMGGGLQDCGTGTDGICVDSGGTDNAGVFDNGTGIATMTCDNNCSPGEGYIITGYFAKVPVADPSNFGGSGYTLDLTGVISDTNLAPVAASATLSASVQPTNTVTIDITGNISDPDGDGVDFSTTQFSYSGSRAPVIVNNFDGTFDYTDTVGADTPVGMPDSFSYSVADTLGKVSATFNVEVTVSTVIPPLTQGFSVLTNKNQAIDVNVLAQTAAGDNTVDPTTVAVPPVSIVGGAVSINATSGLVTFTPTNNVTGIGGFDYTVDDNIGVTSNTSRVVVTVNDPPFAANATLELDRNTTGKVIVPNIASDSDGTLDLTTITATNGTIAGGTTSILFATGEIEYTPPDALFKGADQFTYTIDDDDGATSASGTISVTVKNVVPNTENDAASLNFETNASVVIDVLANDNDVDGTIDPTTVQATDGTNGTTSVNPVTGEVTYTHNGSGFIGQDPFTYTVRDNDNGLSNTGIVTVSLSAGACTIPTGAFFVLETGLIASNDKLEPPVGDGSWFSMELTPNQPQHTSITGFNHLQLDTIQDATVAQPNIDNAWPFSGNFGVHKTVSGITCLTDDGNGNATFDFTGWNVFWNAVNFDLGKGLDNGVAAVTCAADCGIGDTFVLDYRAQVPADASNFPNVKYRLHLEGAISGSAPNVGGGDPNAPFNVTGIDVMDQNGDRAVTIAPGVTAQAVDNTTGIHLSAADIGIKDPFLNDSDGEQCIGGCLDIVITGVTTDYVDLVFHLTRALPKGAIFRKLIDNRWRLFDTSSGDQIGSASHDNVTASCQPPEGEFTTGLREGAQCIFLRIFDGGPNDADGVKNGTIVDPSGALLAGSPNTPTGSKSSSGCSLTGRPVSLFERADWLLITAFVMLLAVRRRRKENNIR